MSENDNAPVQRRTYRRRGPSKRHQDAIAKLAPFAKRAGLRDDLRALGVAVRDVAPCIPDAHEFDCAHRRLMIYELIVTHDVTPAKFAWLRDIRDRLAPLGWSVELWTAHAADRALARLDIDTEQMHESEQHRLLAAINSLDRRSVP